MPRRSARRICGFSCAFLIMLGGFGLAAGAYSFGFEKLSKIAAPRAVNVRRHIRRHRHIHPRKRTGPELGRAESIKAPVTPAPGPAPQTPTKSIPPATGAATLPNAGDTGSAVPSAGPIGPPLPAEWSKAEISAARADCDRRLSGLRISFDRLDPIRDGACGTPAPIRLNGFESDDEPRLTFVPPPIVTCKLAEALRLWFDKSVTPAAKEKLHAAIVSISTLSSYQCRSRYGDDAQRISQHAFANAVDVSEFVAAKSEHISVADYWNAGDDRAAFLRGIHDGACEIFGTTLGPEANESHKNHFHLDMKERRHPLCDFTPEQVKARKQAPRN
ncbi:MAG: extensin family protein, partial [Rhodomicrobium sp.]